MNDVKDTRDASGLSSGGSGALKAISLLQPYASLVALGLKRVETRSWRLSHRGPIVIHASTKWSSAQAELLRTSPFSRYRQQITRGLLCPPLGQLLAVVWIWELQRIHGLQLAIDRYGPTEAAFGDYRAGRWAWMLKGVEELKQAIPCRGRQGIWTLPKEIEEQVLEQIPSAAIPF